MAAKRGGGSRRRKGPGRKKQPGRRSLLRYLLGMLALPLILATAIGVLVLDNQVKARFSGAKWELPTHVYSRPLELYAGLNLPRAALLDELDELGYRRVARIEHPGQFAVTADGIELHARAFPFPEGEQPEQRVRLRLSGSGIVAIQDAGGKSLPLLRLEPIRIGGIYPEHAEDRALLRRGDHISMGTW